MSRDSGSPTSLRRTAVRGVALVAALSVVGTLVGRIAQLILPYYLTPSDFGIFALAYFFFNFMSLVWDLGITTDLVRRNARFDDAIRTGTSIRLGIALAAVPAAFLIGWIAAWAFPRAPLLAPLCVLSLGIVFQALSMQPRVVALRRLDFRRGAIPDAVGKVSGVITTVVLAVVGLAYWSPVYGTVAGLVVAAVLQIATSTEPPKFGYERAVAKEIIGFGKFVTLTGLANIVALSADTFFVGLLLGVAPLGFYSIAVSWGVSLTSSVYSIMGPVSYPVFSQTAGSVARVRRVFLENVRYYSAVSFCLAAGIGVLGPLFITAFYGGVWSPAIVPMQILSAAGLLLGYANMSADLLNSLGRSRVLFARTAFSALIVVLILPVGIASAGLIGTSLAMVGGAALLAILLTHSVSQALSIGAMAWIDVLYQPAAASIVAAIPVLIVGPYISPSIRTFVLIGLLFVCVYVVVMQLMTRGKFLSELRSLLRLALT